MGYFDMADGLLAVLNAFQPDAVLLGAFVQMYLIAVSYTHLDVYKRQVIIAIKEHSPPELIVESTKPLLEITTPIDPEKLHYRVVHINEIRERKQQEAKARTRMAFRIGVPSGTRLTTQSDREAPLSISIQN